MAMRLENLDGGWKMIYSETLSGRKIIWDLSGDGEILRLPHGVEELRKRSISRHNCPNLKRVFIPNFVETIRQNAFDGFGPELEICCQKTGKPRGYFDGEYVERFMEDGAPYYLTHYGCWLHRSAMVRSEDSEGRLTWSCRNLEELCAAKPTVRWGVSPEQLK